MRPEETVEGHCGGLKQRRVPYPYLCTCLLLGRQSPQEAGHVPAVAVQRSSQLQPSTTLVSPSLSHWSLSSLADWPPSDHPHPPRLAAPR